MSSQVTSGNYDDSVGTHGGVVCLANGTTKPIAEVRVGETVLATDPATGLTTGRAVLSTPAHDDYDLVDLAVIGASGTEELIHTSDHHLIWNVDTDAWARAGALVPGTHLRSPNGSPATVARVDRVPGHKVMFDIGVQKVHSFYVATSTAIVLVHNCGETEHVFSESRPTPGPGTPNSIWEQTRSDGSRSVSYYDDTGEPVSREDYDQLSPHRGIPVQPDGRSAPHEHITTFNENGLPTGNWVRELDANGKPVGPWIRD